MTAFESLAGMLPADAPCPLCGETLPAPEQMKDGTLIDAAGDHLKRHGPGDWLPALMAARVQAGSIATIHDYAHGLERVLGAVLDRLEVPELVLDGDVVNARRPAQLWQFEHAPGTIMVRA